MTLSHASLLLMDHGTQSQVLSRDRNRSARNSIPVSDAVFNTSVSDGRWMSAGGEAVLCGDARTQGIILEYPQRKGPSNPQITVYFLYSVCIPLFWPFFFSLFAHPETRRLSPTLPPPPSPSLLHPHSQLPCDLRGAHRPLLLISLHGVPEVHLGRGANAGHDPSSPLPAPSPDAPCGRPPVDAARQCMGPHLQPR